MPGKGIPIGNLTSQLFANIYLNQFDQFVKHILKVTNYVRYTDDFIIVADNIKYLHNLIKPITLFLKEELKLELHPQKVFISKTHQGVDFLGQVVLPHHRTLRTKTRKRMWRKFNQRILAYREGRITRDSLEASLQSYLGMLTHVNGYQLSQKLKNYYWFNMGA